MVMAKIECSQETVALRVYIKSAFKNFEKFIGNSLYNLIKKRLYHSCFLVNLAKLLRTLLLQNTSGQLLLDLRDLLTATGKLLKFWDLVIHGRSTEMLIWKNFQTFKENSSKEEPFLPISFTIKRSISFPYFLEIIWSCSGQLFVRTYGYFPTILFSEGIIDQKNLKDLQKFSSGK